MRRTVGSPEAVRAAVSMEASEVLASLEARTEAAVAELAPPAPEPDTEPTARAVAAAQAAGARRRVREAWQARTDRARAREAWIAEVVAAGTARLRADEAATPPRVRLPRDVEAALRTLPTSEAVVEVPPGAVEDLDPAWCAERAARAGKASVRVVEAADLEDGFRVRSPDGRVTLDQSWAARISRSEARWRRALAPFFSAEEPVGDRP